MSTRTRASARRTPASSRGISRESSVECLSAQKRFRAQSSLRCRSLQPPRGLPTVARSETEDGPTVAPSTFARCASADKPALWWASFAGARLTRPAIRSRERSERLAKDGGPDRDRTGDLMNAIHARSQLRYWPTWGRTNSELYLRRARRAQSGAPRVRDGRSPPPRVDAPVRRRGTRPGRTQWRLTALRPDRRRASGHGSDAAIAAARRKDPSGR